MKAIAERQLTGPHYDPSLGWTVRPVAAEAQPVLTPANDNHVQVGTLPRVVGLQGYGGSGKSEVRRILEKRGYVARHIKEPIAEMAYQLLIYSGLSVMEAEMHIDVSYKRDPIPELGNRSATEIQQFLGTSFGRDFIDPDIWLNIWCRWADGELANGGRVVQESVRFANEADAIRVRGGIVVEVRRPGVGPVNGHVSESLPTTPDFVIQNTGTLADLESKVITAMEMAA